MFTRVTLILRSLLFFWRHHLAVALATAVATAVLTGSLLVGDSMRGSLRALALDRLGLVTHLVQGGQFVRQRLARSFAQASPIILLDGAVTHADTGARVSDAQVLGVTDEFWAMARPGDFSTPPQIDAFGAVINTVLADRIGVAVGDDVLVRVEKPSLIPRETFIGERRDTVATLRLTIREVLPAEGLGRFGLRATQFTPANLYVSLDSLQRRIEQPEMVNAILVRQAPDRELPLLKNIVALEDVGLRLRETTRTVSLESDRLYLTAEEVALVLPEPGAPVGEAAPTPPSPVGAEPFYQPVYAYLANTLQVGEREIPYSMVAALDWAPGGIGFDGDEEGVLLNAWAAEDLQAWPGDRLMMRYFVEGPWGALVEQEASFTVRGVVPMNDPRVADALVPRYPGISDTDRIGDWDPPFPLDLSRIRQRDEDYWETRRAAPKAFIPLARGRQLWGERYGVASSVLVGRQSLNAGAKSKILRDRMMARLEPERLGLALVPVRDESLAAGKGTTDFSGLFVGFSLFLLASAGMLIQMLFRLGVETRMREIGILAAVGMPRQAIRRLLLAEGAAVALVGAVVGVALAYGYAAVMTHGLRTWWVDSIGTPFIRLFASPVSLVAGALISWAVAVVTIRLTVGSFAGRPAKTLLTGHDGPAGGRSRRVRLRWGLAAGFGVVGGALPFAGVALSGSAQAALFFLAGALLLVAALFAFAAWMERPVAPTADRFTLTRLGFSGARRQTGRSVLVVGLVACATFMIVAVGANRKMPPSATDQRSGTGGFALLAESTLPLHESEVQTVTDLAGADAVFALRLRPGDDASCANLYAAARPRVMGVPDRLIERGGFVFAGSQAASDAERENPWLLLNRPIGKDGVIPAIADYTTVVWLLHSGLGQTLTVDGRTFQFVGLLKDSVYQSEILIAADRFETIYPADSGWRSFAIAADPEEADALALELENALEEFGFDAISATERLAALMAVENAYLSTFQALGGLGLLLGTFGLALALMRNLLDRRAELALLRAMGFAPGALLWLSVSENLFLLLSGMGAGTVCALLAVAPNIAGAATVWPGLAAMLAGVLVFGTAAAAGCAWVVLRAPALAVLKAE